MLACTTATLPRQREHSFVPGRVKSWCVCVWFFFLFCLSRPSFTRIATLQPVINQAEGDLSSSGVVVGVPPLGSQCDGNHFHLCCFHARHMKGRPAGSDFLAFAFVSFRFSSLSNRETYIRTSNVIVCFILVRRPGWDYGDGRSF